VPRFLAIDWDQNQLHVVAGVAGGGKVKFERALVWREEKSPNLADAEELGRLLRERLKSAGVAPAPVLACVGRDRVIFKDLRFPAVGMGEEAGVVRFQVFKELTDAPEEVVLDYTTVSAPGASEQQALAVVVRREILTTYQKLCQGAGLKLAALTPRSFGVAASLRKTLAGTPASEDPESAIAVVVVGERWAEFSVLRGQKLLLARSLAVGPGLAGEVRRNLTVYAGQAGRAPIQTLYLAGASDLGELVQIPIQFFDPLAGAAGLDVPPAGRGAFAGAAGLLFARAESRGLPINFVQVRQPRAPRDPNNRRYVLAAAVLALAALGGVLWCWLLYSNAARHLHDIQNQRDQLEAKLVEDRKEAKLYKALDDWDNVVWLDELYDLTARITDPNAIRITSVAADQIARSAKNFYTAKITLKGSLVGNDGHKALDQLIDAFNQDGHYSPEAPKVIGKDFTLAVNVERRPPSEYHHTLKHIPEPADNAGFGGFGDAQP
jgi:Type IV pilus assembly protein PilM